ncbi:hypothetical protein V8G54_018017 [Vigna mungo]|uniref:Uncharacterized protein n=1 Tax=Vigna mungo TaxID=3915 RepID=A0AAQ3N9D3_VIGMU
MCLINIDSNTCVFFSESSIKNNISFKTEMARPWSIDHKFPLSKYRNTDSITRRIVVPSLAKLAILCRQTPDQKAGFLSSSIATINSPLSLTTVDHEGFLVLTSCKGEFSSSLAITSSTHVFSTPFSSSSVFSKLSLGIS